MIQLMTPWGRYLDEQRSLLGFTLRDLADRCGTTAGALSGAMRGMMSHKTARHPRPASIEWIEPLAAALHLDPREKLVFSALAAFTRLPQDAQELLAEWVLTQFEINKQLERLTGRSQHPSTRAADDSDASYS